jgi:hypothetical protein
MAVYAVFEPRMRDDDADRHAERITFVRDGFTWSAFIFGPLWMLRHRLWLAFVVYAVIFAAVGLAQYARALPPGTETVVGVMLALLIGLEAATLRRRKLLWWRWRDAGIVVADNLVSAEQRFFDRWTAGATDTVRSSAAVRSMPLASSSPPSHFFDRDNDVIGMFPPPGGTR